VDHATPYTSNELNKLTIARDRQVFRNMHMRKLK
jgi:hypothetical protein